jgi:hypothetical protein
MDADSTPRILGPDDVLAPGAVDRSVSVVVVVVVMIGLIGVPTMVTSVIGHGISDDPAHDRADRAADDSPGDRTPDETGLVGKGHLG